MLQHSGGLQSLRSALRAGIAIGCIAAAAQAQAKLFIFGDSYSDNGNLSVVTGGQQPGLQYWDGRFTNGWTVAERLAFRLTNASPGRSAGLNGVQYPAGTSVVGGIDFAHGGATAITQSGLPRHLSVYNQVFYFRNEALSRRIAVNNQDTAMIWAGANDLLVYNQTRAVNVSYEIATRQVTLLASTGVGKIVVMNLPNLGDLPGWIDGPRRNALNALTATFNADLAARLTQRQPTTAPKLILVDVNRALVLAHQGLAGGFTVTRPGQNGSASGNCLGDGKVLWDCTPNYLYYDYVHLNASGHEYIASIAQDRINASNVQTSQAGIAASGASAVTAAQGQMLSARIASAQAGFSGLMSLNGLSSGAARVEDARLGFGVSTQPAASLGGHLSLYSYGAAGLDADIDGGERNFGGGVDWAAGSWLAGAAAYSAAPGLAERDTPPDFAIRQSMDGVSAYLAWVQPDASVSLSVGHSNGEQETERLTTIRGLERASGRAHVASTAVTLAGTATETWGRFALKGDAAMVFEDALVSAFQETGTLGLSDTQFDAVQARGVTARLGATAAFSGDAYSMSLGTHYLTRLDGNSEILAALPVAIPGQSLSRFDTGAHAPLTGASEAGAVWVSADWRFEDEAALRLDAAAVATPSGDMAAGAALSLNYKF